MRLTVSVAIFLILSPMGTAFGQWPGVPACDPKRDYGCPPSKSNSADDANAAANARRLQNETTKPRTSHGPIDDMVGGPVDHMVGGPIDNMVHH